MVPGVDAFGPVEEFDLLDGLGAADIEAQFDGLGLGDGDVAMVSMSASVAASDLSDSRYCRNDPPCGVIPRSMRIRSPVVP